MLEFIESGYYKYHFCTAWIRKTWIAIFHAKFSVQDICCYQIIHIGYTGTVFHVINSSVMQVLLFCFLRTLYSYIIFCFFYSLLAYPYECTLMLDHRAVILQRSCFCWLYLLNVEALWSSSIENIRLYNCICNLNIVLAASVMERFISFSKQCGDEMHCRLRCIISGR